MKFPLFKKRQKVLNEEQKEKKSFYPQAFSSSPINTDFRPRNIPINIFFSYYQEISPVADSIDMISTETASLPLQISENKKLKELGDTNLSIFNKINCTQNLYEFLLEMSSFYLISGNMYYIFTGDFRNEPLEIFNVPAFAVTPNIGSDGFALSYSISYSGQTQGEIFNREVDAEGCFRYFNSNKRQELFHTKNFNSGVVYNRVEGVSKMTSVVFEIEQWIKANVQNKAALEQSSNVSGIFTSSPLESEEREKAQAIINNQITGAENAGRTLLLDAEELKYTDLWKGPRETDYLKLKDETRKIIYQRFNIPLPLISDKVMTFSNLAAANVSFYDNAVLPNAKIIFDSLSASLRKRKGTADDFEILVNKKEIGPLAARELENLNNKKSLNVLTSNEIRTMMGLKDLVGGSLLPNTSVRGVVEKKRNIYNFDAG